MLKHEEERIGIKELIDEINKGDYFVVTEYKEG